MNDLEIFLDDVPGALAAMGEAIGRAGVSVDGGGGFSVDGYGVMHFLFSDGAVARAALEAAGLRVGAQREVLAVRLDQERPGQLGAIARRMSDAGVNIEVVYSDHSGRLVLVVDDVARGKAVCGLWLEEHENARV